MTKLIVVAIAGLFSFVQGASAQNQTPAAGSSPGTCRGCTQRAPAEAVSTRAVPGTSETVLVGRIENLIPIAVLASLGCEKCAAAAVAWALQQGSSTEDVDRALRALAQMQTLACFKEQFGPDAAARLEKPLAAARNALQDAAIRGPEK